MDHQTFKKQLKEKLNITLKKLEDLETFLLENSLGNDLKNRESWIKEIDDINLYIDENVEYRKQDD